MPEAATFDGCEMVQKLDSGPVSDLYQAVQQPLGRPVFIKALGRNILPSSPFASTLEREARLLAELDHPGIVKVYDFVRRDSRMWLVLEHVDGLTLEALLEKTRKIPLVASIAIGIKLCDALAHAHSRGVIHRDLQPRHVLVSRRGDVKLMNFSLAVDERMPTAPELLDGGATYRGPVYMSPEQILGEPADPRSDLFSFGVVLYELLTKVRPFDGPDDRTTSLRIRQNPAPPLGQGGLKVPGSLERLVARCLEKLPRDRIASASELGSALRATLAESWSGSPERALEEHLGALGLAEAHVLGTPKPTDEAKRISLAQVAVGFTVIGALALLTAAGLRHAVGSAEANRRAIEPTPMAGAEAALLRVVAHPWANVVIDGQQREITPFARPLRLSPGTHYVRLEHPNAPPERRTVSLAAGESLLLEVDMKLNGLWPEPSASAKSAEGDEPASP